VILGRLGRFIFQNLTVKSRDHIIGCHSHLVCPLAWQCGSSRLGFCHVNNERKCSVSMARTVAATNHIKNSLVPDGRLVSILPEESIK